VFGEAAYFILCLSKISKRRSQSGCLPSQFPLVIFFTPFLATLSSILRSRNCLELENLAMRDQVARFLGRLGPFFRTVARGTADR
jgi:hypothetical protein